MERNFDKDGELRKQGGKVFDFFKDDGKKFIINFNRNKKELALWVVYTHLLQKSKLRGNRSSDTIFRSKNCYCKENPSA